MLETTQGLWTAAARMFGRLRYPQVDFRGLVLGCVVVTYCVAGPFYSAHGLVRWASGAGKQVYQSNSVPESSLLASYKIWDAKVGCKRFREKHKAELDMASSISSASTVQSIQGVDVMACGQLKLQHVAIRVEQATWIPDSLDNLYACRCGLTCLWTKSGVLADKPDALLYETLQPPEEREHGEALRVFLNLEAGRDRAPAQELFVSYHADDDVQATYAGHMFHVHRNYYLSSYKNQDTLVYWSSSRCLPERQRLARGILTLLPHHSFGKCLNNMGAQTIFSMYPDCKTDELQLIGHLHCAMSHYKFVLAIENTRTESYVTEKLFYALDAGAVPIYFGAPNVLDFVPPGSFIDGFSFSTMENLASYVNEVAGDPVLYAEYHAWRRCGSVGCYARARAASLDSLPCRLCAAVSELGGKNATVQRK